MWQIESKQFYLFFLIVLLFFPTHALIHSYGLQETTGKIIIWAQLMKKFLKISFLLQCHLSLIAILPTRLSTIASFT